MRRIDENPPDPTVVASLDAIDSTLAGEPVDPDYAELAELALLLAADRPRPTDTFSAALDERVQRRFARARPAGRPRRVLQRWWLWTPAGGLAAALIAAIAIVLGGGSTRSTSFSAGTASPATAHAFAPASPRATARTPSATAAPGQSAVQAPAPVLQPPSRGRQVIQGGQLELDTAPSRIDQVAQEVFVVVGQANGVVTSSTVTATGGPGGWAQFQLSIPSSSLPQTMAALSSLRYARVASRTDMTQDVTDQYQADRRRLADDRALRTSLLKQLANATTQAQIDSLRAQIHDADAAISSDESTLRGLTSQIDYSRVTVTINGGVVTPVGVKTGGGGFGLGQAAHDAGRVLTVAAGIALIGAAALLPLTLLAALGWWIAAAIRRRRREQALDLV